MGGPTKNGKTEHWGFNDFRIERYKTNILGVKILFGLFGFCEMSFLVSYNS